MRLSRSAVKRGAHVFRVALMIVAGLLAVWVVSTLTIDLGPSLRQLAEREGSKYIERPMHLGRLSVHVLTGKFAIEDFVIEGLTPADRPFLRAKTIDVSLSWPALAHREVLLDSIEMTDWNMLVETFPNGRHNFPRLAHPSSGPRLVTTTLAYVRASQGTFTFEDHGAPWSVVAPNLDIAVTRGLDYRGRASFKGGTVTIGSHLPMWAAMDMVFKLDGPKVHVERLDLATDGAHSKVTGDVDLAHWPEQLWNVRSRVQFPRMREIFFRNDTFTLFGAGDFTGTFHIFKGGRELKGAFESALAGLYEYRFPNLRGALLWVPDRFEVTEASSDFFGGRTTFAYSMAPLGAPSAAAAPGTPLGKPTPAVAHFTTTYEKVDLAELTDFLETRGLRLAGRASGRNVLEWPLGHFSEHTGEGRLTVDAPPGADLLTGDVRGQVPASSDGAGADAAQPLGHVPVSGELLYSYGPDWIDIGPSEASTPRTFVRFRGRTAYGEQSRIPFEVTSADWQESDRILAGVMTAFGAPTHAVAIGGRGHFEGTMLESFRAPRIEGVFSGERMRGFDVLWGDGSARIVVQNGYLDVSNGVVVKDRARIETAGRFALGYPRRDGGEELNARFRVTNMPLVDLKHAFSLDDYNVDGRMSGEFDLYGTYERPFGFGGMTIDAGVAYGEMFEAGTASLRFEGQGVRLDRVELRKSTGFVTGAAFVGWDGTYSFNADGRRLPLESLAGLPKSQNPLTGTVQFSANGSGSFEMPRYDVKLQIEDLFLGEEGIGQVTGRLGVRGTLLTMEVEAASPRLAVSGTGRIALTPEYDADLTFRFSDTSLDPYVRPYLPRLSPFTTAIGSGTIRAVGELSDPHFLVVEGTFDQLRLRLFDYSLQNATPVRLALDGNVVRLSDTRLVGQDTQLQLSGSVDLDERQIAVSAAGRANLGVLQGFFRDIRSSGQAELAAQIRGPLEAPAFSGNASITDGRLRHFAMPRSLEFVNGRILFDARGARIETLTAKLGGGDVQFGGRVTFDGYYPSEVNLTASGQNISQLRYPEGIRSNFDAELDLTGRVAAPTLSGTVTVKSAVWEGSLDSSNGFLNLGGSSTPPPPPATPAPSAFPVQFNIRIVAPNTLEVNSSTAQIVLSADLTLRGTYDRPVLFGQSELLRGVVNVEGRRYVVTRGTLDFTNPARIDPFFDVEAETNVRQPGQTYRVTLHATGVRQRMNIEFLSDPTLPEVDVIAMLFGDVRTSQDAELRALQRPGASQQELLKARAARLLSSPVFSEVGKAVEQTFGVDTFQITPLVGTDPLQQSTRFNPGARLTIGKRVSDRVYLTYARSLNSSNRDQIMLIEFDQTDRLSWIFTRNEDETYALDIRVRHVF